VAGLAVIAALGAGALLVAGAGDGAGTQPKARDAGARGTATIVADDLALPLRGWQRSGHLRLRSARTRDGRELELSGTGGLTRALPDRAGGLSIDVLVPRGATLALSSGGARLTLRRARSGALTAASGGHHERLHRRRGWGAQPTARGDSARGRWRHVELSTGAGPRLAIDGRPLAAPAKLGRTLTLKPKQGAPRVAALVVTRKSDRGALLLHRLAELHARVSPGTFPFGQGSPGGTLHTSAGWTSGFWAGSLWRATDLTNGARLFRRWAATATRANLGRERERIHDQGFRYMESSVAAYDRTCKTSRARKTLGCRALRHSALTAAATLLALQRGNPGAGTIPTLPRSVRCGDCRSKRQAETIVDSMMNVALLDWAYARTHKATYRRAALRHARGVARLLVRKDGSTAQAVVLDRKTGRVIRRHTHQGISAKSTWSRGQGWAVYGFAYTGAALRDKALVRVSERAATYVADHLPAGGVPRFDYDAKPGAPLDTSAGVITAAGLFRLAAACRQLPGACADAERWRPLGERMRSASLAHARARPPLGYLADQVFARGGHARWDDEGDFIFGTDYALEAVGAG
jgi:unsaturated chondroitin disaccharide hydrolase